MTGIRTIPAGTRRTAAAPGHWQALDLLCRAGLGIAPIARHLAPLLRQLVGADAAAIFWLDADGMPDGFFHEDSPATAQRLFLDEFERLFVGPDELNILALATLPGQPIGKLIAPGPRYFNSNTFNLLVRVSGHRHTLDLRVDAAGRARAVVLLFRAGDPGFSDQDAAALHAIRPYLARAVTDSADAGAWQGRQVREGHLILDASCEHILALDDGARRIFDETRVRGLGPQGEAPSARLRECCRAQLMAARPTAACGVPPMPVPGGRLAITASWLSSPGPRQDTPQVLVRLSESRPGYPDLVARAMRYPLSPLQREILLQAGLGHSRSHCLHALGISREAIKKHLKIIYATTGTPDWEALTLALSSPP